MAPTPIRIALTPGAENGVGPELLIKAVAQTHEPCEFFWCGDAASLKLACARAQIAVVIVDENVAELTATSQRLVLSARHADTDLYRRQARFLDESVALAHAGLIDAIVTGPIEKAALAHVKSGPFAGQTEFFAAHLSSTEQTFMAFLGGPFMLSLLTTHVPIRKLADVISEEMIVKHLVAVAKHSARMLAKPVHDVKIALLGLNPHAGEGGLLGHEEETIYEPAITHARALGLCVDGPLAADGFFAYAANNAARHDVVVASYHDQGLSPYKLLAERGAVNVTFGLSHVRVSPAHGTAANLVGTGTASDSSSVNAIRLACQLARETICRRAR